MATKTEKNVQLKINKMTKNIFDQLSVQGLISEDELYLLSDDETGSATWGAIGGELSNQTDLKIMLDSKADKSEIPTVLSAYALSSDVDARLSQKADKSEIPTVNNPTITFTQGNAVKGSITLNQANDQTISLDAGGGGGGGEIPADLSCNHLSVGTSVSLGTGCTASGEYGSIAQGALSKATANAAVALGTQCIASQQLSYAIGYNAETIHNKSMVLALTDAYGARQSKGDNSLNIYVGNGQPSIDALNSILVNGWTLRDHIDEIIVSAPQQQQFYFYPYDTSTTTQQGLNIWIGQQYSNFQSGIICFDVQYRGGYIFYISYTDPITNNAQSLEYYLPPNTQTGSNVGTIITVPCIFGQGVNIYNNNGTDMTVRELFRIECQAYS